MPSRATLAARPLPPNPRGVLAGGGVGRPGGATIRQSMPAGGAGEIVGLPPDNPRAFRGSYRPGAGASNGGYGSGYGANHNNMPVGVINGNQVYEYGLHGTTVLADPRQTTAFSGRTAPTALTSGGTDGRIGTNAPRPLPSMRGGTAGGGAGAYAGYYGANGAGGGGGAYGGGSAGLFSGYGGAGGNTSTQDLANQIQAAQDKANADNEARYQQGQGIINAGQAQQTADLSSGYAGLYATAGQISNDDAIRAKRETQDEVARTTSQLYGMGLANNTGAIMARQGVLDRGSERETAANDTALKAKLGLQQNFVNAQQGMEAANRGEQTNWINNKTVQGPDLGLWAQLLSRPGATGASGAGGYGGAPGYGGYGGGGGINGTGQGFNLTGGGADSSNYGNVNNAGYGGGGGSSSGTMLSPPTMPEQFYGYDFGAAGTGVGGMQVPFTPGGNPNQPQPAGDPNSSNQNLASMSVEDMKKILANNGFNPSTWNDQYVRAIFGANIAPYLT